VDLRPGTKGFLYNAAKGGRNFISETVAELLYRSPAAERMFTAGGRVAHNLPLVKLFHRKTVEAFLEKLAAAGEQHRKVNLCGVKLTLDVSEFTTKDYYFSSVLYEPQTTRFFLGQLKGGELFVDIGANHGYYTLLAASCVGAHGKVFAFEPNPGVALQLNAHVALNGFDDRVDVLDLAVSDKSDDEADFFVSNCPDNSGLSSLVMYEHAQELGHLSPDNKIFVRTTTFDEWSEEAGLARVDLVKIDVEGAEELVLHGMSKTLATRPPRKIICETKCDSPAHAILISHGYTATPLEVNEGSWGNILYTHEGKSLAARNPDGL
jgi:FkbM family methyltransferase